MMNQTNNWHGYTESHAANKDGSMQPIKNLQVAYQNQFKLFYFVFAAKRLVKNNFTVTYF